jgi:hypothetical protein
MAVTLFTTIAMAFIVFACSTRAAFLRTSSSSSSSSRRRFHAHTLQLQSSNNNNNNNKNLWSVEECLAAHRGKENVVFVDGSWYHKGNRDGRQEFLAGPRIPGARYFDMTDIATSFSVFPELNPKDLVTMEPPEVGCLHMHSHYCRYFDCPSLL